MAEGQRGARPAELLEGVVSEVRCFHTPADALDAMCSEGEIRLSDRAILVVVDQRGSEEVPWTWLALLANLALGPVILLVDKIDSELERRAQRCGVSRCLESQHLERHPRLLMRAARRALQHGRPLEVAVIEI